MGTKYEIGEDAMEAYVNSICGNDDDEDEEEDEDDAVALGKNVPISLPPSKAVRWADQVGTDDDDTSGEASHSSDSSASSSSSSSSSSLLSTSHTNTDVATPVDTPTKASPSGGGAFARNLQAGVCMPVTRLQKNLSCSVVRNSRGKFKPVRVGLDAAVTTAAVLDYLLREFISGAQNMAESEREMRKRLPNGRRRRRRRGASGEGKEGRLCIRMPHLMQWLLRDQDLSKAFYGTGRTVYVNTPQPLLAIAATAQQQLQQLESQQQQQQQQQQEEESESDDDDDDDDDDAMDGDGGT